MKNHLIDMAKMGLAIAVGIIVANAVSTFIPQSVGGKKA